ncbi:hypothetical protein E1B28_006256 [Marasmius oreades]|uniref:tRNA-guanine(15) transglycosylase-like domain-containing protein n=1 Tax=Marasmius oreades TaxID=181124 RepID=A0A9P7S7Q4_9AGAR|nr:uncharacterized protein E1B28_006256 [Marasmius oreades]KAG7095518.1 hypothetical protein E1B28_006256 [Marasmius oreades]
MFLSFENLSSASSSSSTSLFGPRLGSLVCKNGVKITTPNLITPTSRGVVPHLSRDNVLRTQSISWIHVPYESFLECKPPIPTLGLSLHDLLGFRHDRHVISMSLRDLSDGREMPSNAAKYVSAWCIRGARKVTPEEYRRYTSLAKPDIVYALADVQPVASQKRLIKSVERTAEWLVQLLKPCDAEDNAQASAPSIILQMPGGQSNQARSAFAHTLIEPLHPTDVHTLKPLRLSCLDDAISGYAVDGSIEQIKASLDGLNEKKLRIAHSTTFSTLTIPPATGLSPSTGVDMIRGPHDMLDLIRDVGIDLFGAEWVIKLAQWGIALDFEFPPPQAPINSKIDSGSGTSPKIRGSKRDIGHNLYDVRYRMDCTRLLNSNSSVTCPCFTCAPSSCSSEDVIRHSRVDDPPLYDLKSPPRSRTPHTRAYIHHLLHTHEMSSYALLVGHNLAIISTFLQGVRNSLELSGGQFNAEVDKFFEYYASGEHESIYPSEVAKVEAVVEAVVAEATEGEVLLPQGSGVRDTLTGKGTGILLFDEARVCHAEVERLRGKGSLKRDREVG